MSGPYVHAQPLLEAIRMAELSETEAARLAGYDTVRNNVRDGLLTVWQVDNIAIRALGRHPVEIYGHYWLDQQALHDEQMRPTADVEREVRINRAFTSRRQAVAS